MQLVKKFNHPSHYVNWMRKAQKDVLRTMVVRKGLSTSIPYLEQSNTYYFIFERLADNAQNVMKYAVCCFDSDGVIIFSYHSIFPVSLWRFRRQGLARAAVMVEGVIRSAFKRNGIPLESESPFSPYGDGLYVCNISWSLYNLSLKN